MYERQEVHGRVRTLRGWLAPSFRLSPSLSQLRSAASRDCVLHTAYYDNDVSFRNRLCSSTLKELHYGHKALLKPNPQKRT
jgi:hypothetical protein